MDAHSGRRAAGGGRLRRDSTNSNDIYFQRYNSSDTAQGSETRANASTTNGQNAPAIAALTDGGFVVAWHGNGTGDADGVYFQRYNSSGTAQGSETKANTQTTNAQSNVDVHGVASGGFVVVWDGNGPTGTDSDGVFGRRYLADGTAVDAAEFLINDVTTGAQTLPAVAADGSFYVAWQSPTGADTADIYVRKFAADGTPASSASPPCNMIASAIDSIRPSCR